MSNLVVQNVRVVSPTPGLDALYDVHVRGAAIADLRAPQSAVPSDARIVDGTDCVLLPGPLDLGCTFRAPARPDVETLSQTLNAAARGGITRVVALPNGQHRHETPEAAAAFASRLQGEDRETAHLVGGCLTSSPHPDGPPDQDLAEIASMAAAGVRLFTNAPGGAVPLDVVRSALEMVAAAKACALVWGPEPSLAGAAVVNESAISTRLGVRGQPHEAESLRAHATKLLAQRTGARALFGPVSTAATLATLAANSEEATPACGALACAWSLLLDETAHEDRPFDVNLALHPPLRPASDQRALLRAAQRGDLAVTAGHRPRSNAEKEVEFGRALVGGSALELALPALVGFETTADALDPAGAALAFSEVPALLLGEKDVGIGVGQPAHFVMLSRGDGGALTRSALSTPCQYSPYLGLPRRSTVELTVSSGRIRFERSRG